MMDALMDLRAAGAQYALDAMARRVVADMRAYALHSLAMIAGRVRAGRDAARVQQVLARAAPPPEMQAAPVAPARGAMRLVDNIAVGHDGDVVQDGVRWQSLDPLSIMCRQAYVAHRRRGDDSRFSPPFTPGQIAMALHYQGLVERHEAAGVKCVSLEGRGGGSGHGGGFADAYLAEGREIEAIRRRVSVVRGPDGSQVQAVALEVRRVRPSARGGRSIIMARRLVDLVVLGSMDLSAVLRAHGWSDDGKHRAILKVALGAALDRAQGYSEGGSKKGD